MTVKGKRAQALRKMDPKEAEGMRMGGVLDTDFPTNEVHASLAAAKIDPASFDEFDEFFGHALGLFRMFQGSCESAPPVSKERELVGEAMACVEELRTRMDALPPRAAALIDEVCWARHNELFFNPAQRLDTALKEVRFLLAQTQQKLEMQKSTGRPKQYRRDGLLCDVAHWLQARNASLSKKDAAKTAAEILRACGIAAPEDPDKARELVRKHEAPQKDR